MIPADSTTLIGLALVATFLLGVGFAAGVLTCAVLLRRDRTVATWARHQRGYVALDEARRRSTGMPGLQRRRRPQRRGWSMPEIRTTEQP